MSDAAAALAADMARLEARPYREVGVPMVLLAEDLTGARPAASGEGDPALADALVMLGRLAGDAPLSDAAAARVIEVFADRYLLGADGPVFTRLGDGAAA